ncbi:MAG: tRNA uridine-5-carboxymethylaminomethyl(34) synthesis enzyme MnmG [Clostridiales bacterium]|nr:tRNA uridine-5-carboxymethylaminomethyl(34) synthesis enzyme MnmG [Clostridiales bacterium]
MKTNYEFLEYTAEAVVVGAGHAGCEAALALARTGIKTALLTLNLDSIGFMPCNPSIGGTAKGHLVREIDALGGEMGIVADKTALQIRMLNVGKGAAVQSLRAQSDKNAYHREMKRVLENTENLRIIQAEVSEILQENGKCTGVKTTYGGIISCKAVILCTGVYLNGETITGHVVEKSGPNGFAPANHLTESLISLGFNVRRFKTGTPARVDSRTIDYSKCEIQNGDTDIYPFSFMHDTPPENKMPCYLTYTNLETHGIIMDNLDRSPLYDGTIQSTGPRYCPSIETKVVRFKDKERHQIFIEPEGADTLEMYVQGMSTSMPHDVQRAMYASVAGLEHADIMRYGYAIEYDCIDTLDVLPTLEFKKVEGVYTAGQINGTSGYEEAAAQGLMAGLNASLKLRGLPPFVLRRDEAYIGVLIDDLVTKGTDEPYRMMTSRAEHRICLRQDNADFRLTEKGMEVGLVTNERKERYLKRKAKFEELLTSLQTRVPQKEATEFLSAYGYGATNGSVSYADMLKRSVPLKDIMARFNVFSEYSKDVLETAEISVKYEGYLKQGVELIEKAKRLENKLLPADIDYNDIKGLRLEAQEKLNRIRPFNLGQAGRISGVNPADVSVLMVWLAQRNEK